MDIFAAFKIKRPKVKDAPFTKVMYDAAVALEAMRAEYQKMEAYAHELENEVSRQRHRNEQLAAKLYREVMRRKEAEQGKAD